MAELKPCPFCAAPVQLCDHLHGLVFRAPNGHAPDCPFRRRSWRTRAQAIAAWNDRALERLDCARCGKTLAVHGPPGNPNMEVCGPCHAAIFEEEYRRAEPDPPPFNPENHHASCQPSDMELEWRCGQCGGRFPPPDPPEVLDA